MCLKAGKQDPALPCLGFLYQLEERTRRHMVLVFYVPKDWGHLREELPQQHFSPRAAVGTGDVSLLKKVPRSLLVGLIMLHLLAVKDLLCSLWGCERAALAVRVSLGITCTRSSAYKTRDDS